MTERWPDTPKLAEPLESEEADADAAAAVVVDEVAAPAAPAAPAVMIRSAAFSAIIKHAACV